MSKSSIQTKQSSGTRGHLDEASAVRSLLPAAAEGRDAEELSVIFDRAAQYFSLLSEPSRIRIIQAVCDQERSVQDVVAITELPQPNVSRHLSLLYRSGVLSRRRSGTFVYYRISDPLLTDLCRTVCVRLVGQLDHTLAATELSA